jgi:Na+/melibiose symporter-like transporter
MSYFTSRLQPFIRAFIISDALLYSSLNIVNVLFVVYVTTVVAGGTVQSATTAIAAGLIARVLVELSVGRASSKLVEKHKLLLIISGMAAISISYAGFALAHNTVGLALLWILNGAGWAIGHPAKLALVARHINHDQASQEWGFADALNMSLVVVTMVIGAYIVSHFSYGLVFTLAAFINTAGIIPYVLYARSVHWR